MAWDLIAPIAAGLATFLAVLAVLWPRETQGKVLAAWDIPDDEAFDEALRTGTPLPWTPTK